MSDLLELMAAPFVACAVLVGIHAYLGLHVIQRKIIFVDLALAQIAALGATFGFLLGVSPHSQTAYGFSLCFAVVGAGIFALTRMRHERIPQEAIIGIVYAVALAAAILVADRAPEGSEHIKESLTGSLLWVRWPVIFKTAAIYALVGLLHVALRKRFFQISFDPEQAYAEGRLVRLWDFIFYVTFAFVITSSVAIAGVLVVFSFLVIPAVIATLFAHRISTRLTLGWVVGIAACVVGLVASYRFDLPSGPSVVVSLGGALLLAGMLYSILAADHKGTAVLRIFAGVGVVALLLAGIGVFASSSTFLHIAHEHSWEAEALAEETDLTGDSLAWHELQGRCSGDIDCLAAGLPEIAGWDERAVEGFRGMGVLDRESWIAIAGRSADPQAMDLLAEEALVERDPLLRLAIAEQLVGAAERRGLGLLVELLEDGIPPFVRDESYQILSEFAGHDFGYDPFAESGANRVPIAEIQAWMESRMAGSE
jgi:zinc/manganese transport system permease protein